MFKVGHPLDVVSARTRLRIKLKRYASMVKRIKRKLIRRYKIRNKRLLLKIRKIRFRAFFPFEPPYIEILLPPQNLGIVHDLGSRLIDGVYSCVKVLIRYRKFKKKSKRSIHNWYYTKRKKTRRFIKKLVLNSLLTLTLFTIQCTRKIKEYCPNFIGNLVNKIKPKKIKKSLKKFYRKIFKYSTYKIFSPNSVKNLGTKLFNKTKLFINKIWLPIKLVKYYDYINTLLSFLIMIIYFYPLLKYLNYQIGHYFRFGDRRTQFGLLMYVRYLAEDSYQIVIPTFLLLIASEIYINKINKIKNVKSTYKDRLVYKPQIFERIFVVLNYLILWLGVCSNKPKLTERFLHRLFPKFYKYFFDGIFLPWLRGLHKVKGFRYGVANYICLYFSYSKIVRNNKVIPYFIRYHFMNAQLSSVIFEFCNHLSIFLLKYYKYIDFMNYRHYKLMLRYYSYWTCSIWIFYCILSALIGLLSPLKFIDSAIFWQVGMDSRVR